MRWRTRKQLRNASTLRNRRVDSRLVLASSLLIALIAASTVVSADALLRLPELWHASTAAIDASLGPRLPDATEHPAGAEPPQTFADIEPERAEHADPLPQERETTPVPEYARTLRTADYAQSWRQAGGRPDQLGTIRRSHQVRLGPEGRLTGQIVSLNAETGNPDALPNLRIRLLHRGTLAATGHTDEQGLFEIEGLTTGTYALVAADDDTLLSYSLHVLTEPTGQGGEVAPQEAISPKLGLRLESAAIVGADAAAALSQIATLQTDGVVEVSRFEPPPEEIPEGARPLSHSGAYGTPLLRHSVPLQADGQLIGRVRSMHPESGRPLLLPTTRVMLLRNGAMTADGLTDEKGCFSITGVAPGVYSLVAVTISEDVSGNVVERNPDPTQPVGLFDERTFRPGYATLAIEVRPAGLLRRGDQPHPPPADEPGANELLELDFALIDAYDSVVSATRQASEIQHGRTSFAAQNASSRARASRLAPPGSARTPSRPQSVQGGGAPIGWNTPLLPPAAVDTGMMSPSTL